MPQKKLISFFFMALIASISMVFYSPLSLCECSAAITDPVPPRFFAHHGMGFGSNGIATPAKPYGLFRIWDHWGCGNTGWAGLEPSRGAFNWKAMDAVVDSLKTKNVDILYCFGKSTPSWAAARETDPPTNIADWDNFLTAFINRYHTNIKFLEAANEAMEGEGFYTGTIPQLVNLAKHLDSIANRIDPSITILTPNATGGSYNMGKFYSDYFAAGGGQYADVVAFHGYCSGAGSWSNTVTPAEEILDIVTALKGAMNTYGQGSKPIWNTEASWGDVVNSPTADDRVAFLARHYLLQWSVGVSVYAWYCWDNNNGLDQWGQLWDPSAGIRPAGVAYGQLYNWMVGATMSQPHSVSGTVYTCGFTRPGGYQALAVWNTAGNSTYTVPSGYTRCRDLAGGTSTVSGSITIGKKPILLENMIPTSINSNTSKTTDITIAPRYDNALQQVSFSVEALSQGSVPVYCAVYNLSGMKVMTLLDTKFQSGRYTVSLASNNNLAKGIYTLILKIGQKQHAIRFALPS